MVIHSVYNNLLLLIPNSQFISPPLTSPLLTTNLFSRSVLYVCFGFVDRLVCDTDWIPYLSEIIYLSFSLPSVSVTVSMSVHVATKAEYIPLYVYTSPSSFTQMLFLVALSSFQALWVLSGCIQGRVCPGSIHMTRLSAPRLSSESAVSAFSPESDCLAEAGFSHHRFLFPAEP